MKTDVKPKHTLISLSQVEHESWHQIKTYTYKSVLRSILELDAPIMYFFMENLVFVLIFYVSNAFAWQKNIKNGKDFLKELTYFVLRIH